MASEIERAAFDKAYPRIADALTLYVWRRPAFPLTRWAARAGFPPVAVTLLEALLCALVFALFWRAHYWLGLVAAAAVMIVSVVTTMIERFASPQAWTRRLRLTIEVAHPPLWWWAWEHGLPAYGRPLEPVYATMVLWVIVGSAVALRVVEELSIHRFGGMEIHAWRRLDSKVRLVSAGRNSNVLILAGSLLFGRPDSGLVLVAWWMLISLIFHAVRLAQLTERQTRRQTITSWLDG
jgi:hypothetical protein